MRCMNDLEIGNRLKQFRLGKKVKMIDAALEFDISTAQYSRLENGQGRISVDVLNKACRYYNTSIDYILFGETASQESIYFQKLQHSSEIDLRRVLKILSCLMTIGNCTEYLENPSYKIFMGGLLEQIPVDAPSSMPYVLEYEKNHRKVSENTIIKELGITRFKWNSIMQGKRIQDVSIPLKISNQYGYDMDFLINNRLSSNQFFDELMLHEKQDKQKSILKIFDSVIRFQNQEYFLEVQKKK